MAVELREWWTQKRKDLVAQGECRPCSAITSFFIPSALESKGKDEGQPFFEDRSARAKHCTNEGVKAGFKAGSVACVASAIPTLAAVRLVPWAKANVNYTGQALIVSAATIATYFIVTEQTILECSRSVSYSAIEKSRSSID